MRKYIVIIVLTTMFIILGGLLVGSLVTRQGKYQKRIRTLEQQLAYSSIKTPIRRNTIRDTIKTATTDVVMAELIDLRRQKAIDEKIISDLKLQLSQIQSIQTTGIGTTDTVTASVDTLTQSFMYHDQWSDIRFSLRDTTFYYNIRDSLKTIVYREYKHRFLWWRWGTKGYRVTIVNFNPHASIQYNTYVHTK